MEFDGKPRDAADVVIAMLEENMRQLEEMQEEKIRMQQAHQDEKDRLEEHMEQIVEEWMDQKAKLEERMVREKEEMKKEMDAYRDECEREMAEQQKAMAEKVAEFQHQREQMEQEKMEMIRQMEAWREKSERQMAEEKMAAERRLLESRKQTEEQLNKEREITDHIMVVLRELPPLQTAMELGDLGLLEDELQKWTGGALPERFGDCRHVVEAVLKLAHERVITWRNLEHTFNEVLRESNRMPASLPSLCQQSQRYLRTIKEAQLTNMNISRSNPKFLDCIYELLVAWQQRAMSFSNSVQKLILHKVVMCQRLGSFDFADLDICLRLVDRPETPGEVFLARAKALVEDEKTEPKDFRGLLGHLETMLFFLKYTKLEDMALTYAEFQKQSSQLDAIVWNYIVWAQQQYPPGNGLVQLSDGLDVLNGRDVAAVMEELRRPPSSKMAVQDGVRRFREIFYQWALAMQSKFNLLVLPHHSQVVCLLIFQRFLETAGDPGSPHSLIAQVGTGEGKSMIVAALAIYVVMVLGKKAHVVVDDESLLERDFGTFKALFNTFEVTRPSGRRPLSAKLCVSEERLAAVSKASESGVMTTRVDPDADICYCEAKHVQSFYVSTARSEKCDFDAYEERVLILDEVDALVIDEEPNQAFVYHNEELSEMATEVAQALARQASADDLHKLRERNHPAAPRVLMEMTNQWDAGKRLKAGEDFTFVKEFGKYCELHAGQVNHKAWSLALECRNFQDGLARNIKFQERRFVMSRPRVFKRYHKILGLSGSIGSAPERNFLRDTYQAAFFEVPPFLKTCKGSPFHEAIPVQLGGAGKDVYVEPTFDAQIQRLAEVTLEARERVPVLVIAKDRSTAEIFVEKLRAAARSRGLGSASEDVVRSLSRRLYEADPEQWKENLNRATLPLVEGVGSSKTWRVTVTDPRGGRGTDYRVDSSDVDAQGGLLLIPTVIPTSRRDWTQFLGRTARQDRRGQFCAVLCASDYDALAKNSRQMPSEGGQAVVKHILSWGDQDIAERIQASAALYNCGLRMNELCEEVYGKNHTLLKDPAVREKLVDVCQRYRFMSVSEVDDAFVRILGSQVQSLSTEAQDLGRPVTDANAGIVPATASVARLTTGSGTISPTRRAAPQSKKVVIFCLDWSASMMSRDTRTPLTRFETCLASVKKILQEQVNDDDMVGVVCFGPNVQVVFPPTQKGKGGMVIERTLERLQPQSAGGTCFFDAVATCIQQLGQPSLPAEAHRWLVCLTDGDDLGSRPQNARGEYVTQMLQNGGGTRLNMVMITVGQLKAQNVQIIDSWVAKIESLGFVGQHLAQSSAAAIAKAFDVVAECLAAEVGGATEC